ncbi:hypothetical protein ACIB24_20925 [Spongisporangium articulatum]|uniref:Uncharacterized protein n=1 Tax=Spongisporangium articulatum TaxID=3362603 RepID=A0ABW8AUH5_9ACTN
MTETPRGRSILETVGSIASILTVLGGVTVFFFSTPVDLLNKVKSHTVRSLTLAVPATGASVLDGQLQVCGTADLDPQWVLVALVQSPDQLTYYVTGGGAIAVGTDGKWRTGGHLGSMDAKELARESGKNFKVIVVALDDRGQRQLQPALAKEAATGGFVTTAIPHNAMRVQADVHPVVDDSDDTQGSCDEFMAAED